MADEHLIGGRYRVEELLGRGGMAEVRKGTDVRLGRTVAIKRLRTDLASDSTFQARFRREAQAAASLNHPSIVSVYDTGEELATDGSGVSQPYIVMEYVAGSTLRDVLKEGRKILPERALEITSGVLGALDYSHRAGIIHRDIKPGNVMLTPTGDVKVMDFGIARAVSDASSTMTQTAAVVGTAQYLSPEQARGEQVDSRSDVYSAGCLLYELLCGRPPFIGESPVAVAYQHVREQAAPPSRFDADLNTDLDAIVMKALEKDPAQRYESAGAMKSDIDRYLAGHPVQAPKPAPVPPPARPLDETSTQLVEPIQPEPEEPARKKGPTWLLLLLLLALVLGGAWFGYKAMTSSPETTAVPTVLGMTQDSAEQSIVNAGLTVGTIKEEPSTDYPAGQVSQQSPGAGDLVPPDSPVDLVISTGKPQVQLPNVVGSERQAAKDQILQADPTLVVQWGREDSDEPRDTVIRMEPNAGAMVESGSTVRLILSNGPKKVPNVVGRTQEEAVRLIQEAGFKPSVVLSNDPSQPAGTVISQSPTSGQTQPKGTIITIVVSNYTPAPSPTPTPTDEPTDIPTP
jgi:serine/threonine protein kinase